MLINKQHQVCNTTLELNLSHAETADKMNPLLDGRRAIQ